MITYYTALAKAGGASVSFEWPRYCDGWGQERDRPINLVPVSMDVWMVVLPESSTSKARRSSNRTRPSHQKDILKVVTRRSHTASATT